MRDEDERTVTTIVVGLSSLIPQPSSLVRTRCYAVSIMMSSGIIRFARLRDA
jgi:hypothetical protein